MENMNKTYLICGKECGTNSGDIYETYAAAFRWDMDQSSQFGAQGQPLYAREATPEGYSVWCISYSNLNNKKGDNGRTDFPTTKRRMTRSRNFGNIGRMIFSTIFPK